MQKPPQMKQKPAADETDPVAILRSNARLAANQVRRSRTGLGQATSESDFETRRLGLTQSVNAAFATQILLLDALGLSEADYQDRFEDAEDTRDAALTRATSSVNTFTEARIKGEEDAAEAAQDAADEIIDAAERTERERMRIAERHQRAIDDLREDAIDAEQDRADRLVELEEDTQGPYHRYISEMPTAAKRILSGIFSRTTKTLHASGRKPKNEITRQLVEGSITSGEANERFEALGRDVANELTALDRERRRDLENAGIRQTRRTEDVNIRQDRSAQDIEQRATTRQEDIQAQSDALATAIQVSLAPLLEQQETGEVAEKQIEAAGAQTTAAAKTESAATDLGTVATALKDSDISGAIDLVRQSAEASLGISSSIEALPGLLESSFKRIFDDLQETIIDLLEIQGGIQGGVGQFLLDTLIDSGGAVTGIVGQTAAFALQISRH